MCPTKAAAPLRLGQIAEYVGFARRPFIGHVIWQKHWAGTQSDQLQLAIFEYEIANNVYTAAQKVSSPESHFPVQYPSFCKFRIRKFDLKVWGHGWCPSGLRRALARGAARVLIFKHPPRASAPRRRRLRPRADRLPSWNRVWSSSRGLGKVGLTACV